MLAIIMTIFFTLGFLFFFFVHVSWAYKQWADCSCSSPSARVWLKLDGSVNCVCYPVYV